MKRALKWLGILFGVLVLVVIAVPFFLNVNDFRPTLEARLTTALGREVKLGNLRLRLLRAKSPRTICQWLRIPRSASPPS